MKSKNDNHTMRIAVVCGMLAALSATVSYGGNLTLPTPVFNDGDTLTATQLNGNFSAIETEVDGNALDLINHSGDAAAHHPKYTDSEAVTAVLAADGAGSGLDADTVDGLHASQLTTALSPQLWASIDSTPAGVTLNSSSGTTINSVTVTAGVDGFLLISGSVFVNGSSLSTPTFFQIIPKINGVNIIAGNATADSGSVTSKFIDPLASDKYGESSYTIAAPITAGTHTVSQFLSAYRSGTNPLETFFYNRHHLTVLFVPLGNGSVAGIAAALSTVDSTSANQDTNGE